MALILIDRLGDNGGGLLIEDSGRRSGRGSGGYGGVSAPSVFCIVVNWNGVADTMACLATLMQQEYSALRVIVVDNGSSDDSVKRIRGEFPTVCVIEAGGNLGFARGTNVGIRRAMEEGAEFVWLLNNDTLSPPDTCTKLVAKAEREPGAAAVGSVLYYMHDPAKVQAWGGGDLAVWLGRSKHFYAPAKLGAKSYLTFASALIRREALLRVGVLYEGFFMYWDDADYALRLTEAGYGLVVAEDTAVLHKEGGSADRRSALIDRYSFAAGLHFLRRHAALPVVSMGIFLGAKLVKRVTRGEWKNAGAVFAAVRDYRKQRRNNYRETV
jgi:GT2 family glycosyltransferase